MVDKSNIVNREEYFMGESRQLKLEHLDIGSFVKQGWLFALTVALWDKKKKNKNFDTSKGCKICKPRKPACGCRAPNFYVLTASVTSWTEEL